MTDTNWDEVGRDLLRNARVTNFEKIIKEPLEETINTLKMKHTDIVLLLIFTYIDLLGYLFKGSIFSKNAVAFIREYIGRVDPRYKEIGGLLYHALRHGYVHLGTPKRIQLKDEKILDFSFGIGKREDSFKFTKTLEFQMTGERSDIYRLFVNVPLLYKDLLSAMDMYAEEIRHNQELSDVFWEAFETRREPEKEKDIRVRYKSYLRDSDFDFLRAQISRL